MMNQNAGMVWDREKFKGRLLRHVEMEGYTLLLWDTYQCRNHKSMLGYRFQNPRGEVVFEGEDFGCPPSKAIDSDACVRGLLNFLTLKPGDTDDEYFEKYSSSQMAFAEGDAEDLSSYAMEEFGAPAFHNLDGFVSAWEVEVHGVYLPDYWPGASAGPDFRHIGVGSGSTDEEAFEVAMDYLAQGGHQVDGIEFESEGVEVDYEALAAEWGVEVEDLEDEQTPLVYVTIQVR